MRRRDVIIGLVVAVAVVAVVAIVLSRLDGLDGRLPALAGAGVASALVAAVVMDRTARTPAGAPAGAPAASGVAMKNTPHPWSSVPPRSTEPADASGSGRPEANPATFEPTTAGSPAERSRTEAAPAGASTAATRPVVDLVVETFIEPKAGESPDTCEDAAAVDARSGRFAVADGASSSWRARAWAQILAEEFIAGPPDVAVPERFVEWVRSCASRWTHDEAGGGAWYSDKASERGAHATLIGVELVRRAAGRTGWRAVAYGDSCVFHVRGDTLVTAFPAKTFGSFPALLASSVEHEADVADVRVTFGDLRPGDVLVLATDAIAKWVVLGELYAFVAAAPIDDVRSRAVAARSDGTVENDDLTVVRLAAR